MLNNPRVLGALAGATLLAGCAATAPDPGLTLEAADAIELAERTGAEDHAPLELARARELLDQARALAGQDEGAEAARIAERAALQARLAIVRATGSARRAELERRRAEYETLRRELEEAFGEALRREDS